MDAKFGVSSGARVLTWWRSWEGGRAALRRFARGSPPALALLVLTLRVRFRFSRSRSLHLLVLCGRCAPSCF